MSLWYETIKQNQRLTQILRFNPRMDKIRIAEKMDISAPTLYKLLDELKREAVLNDEGKLNKDFGALAGISIGTSVCKIIFLHFDFSEYSCKEFAPYKAKFKALLSDDPDYLLSTPLDRNTDTNYFFFKTPDTFARLKKYLDCIFSVIQQAVSDGDLNLLTLGISCTGCIDEKKQLISEAHNLEYLSGRGVSDLLFDDRVEFFASRQITVTLTQNSKASAIAEKLDIIKQSDTDTARHGNVCALYLDYGLGAGFILDGKLYTGANGYAGEVGHIPIPSSLFGELDVNGDRCACGSDNCIDLIIRSVIFGEAENFKNMTSAQIEDYLEKHRDSAEKLARLLGYITNLLAAILNLDLVVLTGKLYKSIPLLKKDLEEALDGNNLKFNRSDCKISASKAGTLSPTVGAAIYSYFKSCEIEIKWD